MRRVSTSCFFLSVQHLHPSNERRVRIGVRHRRDPKMRESASHQRSMQHRQWGLPPGNHHVLALQMERYLGLCCQKSSSFRATLKTTTGSQDSCLPHKIPHHSVEISQSCTQTVRRRRKHRSGRRRGLCRSCIRIELRLRTRACSMLRHYRRRHR